MKRYFQEKNNEVEEGAEEQREEEEAVRCHFQGSPTWKNEEDANPVEGKSEADEENATRL